MSQAKTTPVVYDPKTNQMVGILIGPTVTADAPKEAAHEATSTPPTATASPANTAGQQPAPDVAQTSTANGSKGPGYVTAGLSFKELANLTLNISLSRDGTVFFTPQLGGGVSQTGFNGSLVAGNLNGPENASGKAVDAFLSGRSSNIMGGAIVGGGATGNGNQTAREVGVMTPQVSFGFGYGIRILKLPGVHW